MRLPFAPLLAALALAAAAETPAEDAAKLAAAGRYAEAVPKFEQALRAEPKSASLHLGLGLAQQALKDYPAAARSLEAAARLSPDSPEPLYSLGLLYEAAAADPAVMKDRDPRPWRQKALKAWERYLKVEKDPKRLETGRGHLERAKEALR